MKIVIDSNIFIADFGFNSPNWRALVEYTNSFKDVKVCIPQVVLDEVSHHYKCKVKEINATITKLKKSLISVGEKNTNIDLINEEQEYIQLFNNNVICTVLPYPTNILKELIQRTIKRLKPAKQDGKDVRDTLIWLQIKELAKNDKDKEVIFITENVTDFCSPKSKLLLDELKSECDDINIDVKLCTSLKMIVEEYITPMIAKYPEKSFSISKLYKLTDKLYLGDIVCDAIRNDDGYYDYFKENYNYGYDGISSPDSDTYVIANYTLTPLDDGSLIVNMIISGECTATPFDVDDPKEFSIQCYDPINIKYTLDCAVTLKENNIINHRIENIKYELD